MIKTESDGRAATRLAEPRRRADPNRTAACPVLALQRAVGNRAVASLFVDGRRRVAQRWDSPSSTSENRPADADQGPDGGGGDETIRDAGPIAGVDETGSGGGDAGAGEAAGGGAPTTPATPSAQIDVRATQITGLGGLPVYHLFVVYTDPAGAPFFFRGGPSSRGSGGYGNIRCDHGRYVPGTVDWAPGAPSETSLNGPGAVGKDATFVSELSRIDGASIPYQPTGPNSNSVARTLLNRAGVPEVKPVWIAPGWGQIL